MRYHPDRQQPPDAEELTARTIADVAWPMGVGDLFGWRIGTSPYDRPERGFLPARLYNLLKDEHYDTVEGLDDVLAGKWFFFLRDALDALAEALEGYEP